VISVRDAIKSLKFFVNACPLVMTIHRATNIPRGNHFVRNKEKQPQELAGDQDQSHCAVMIKAILCDDDSVFDANAEQVTYKECNSNGYCKNSKNSKKEHSVSFGRSVRSISLIGGTLLCVERKP